MERITRALELAYAQRGAEPRAVNDVKVASRAGYQLPTEPPAVDFTETVMFKTPAIELDPQTRDNERILPPGGTGPYGGAYKMLRTQVLRRMDQLGATTLGVMSATSGAGKTLTAINLAIAIAADPARTALLIDFDLKNPQIHRRFHHEPTVGVDECLEQRRPLREAMFKVAGYERLTIVASRSRVEHSSELLSSVRMAEVIEEMRARYTNRVLIFDMPPILETDDALAFVRNLQAGLLVVGEGKTQRQDLARSMEMLRELTFVGTVLNGSRERVEARY